MCLLGLLFVAITILLGLIQYCKSNRFPIATGSGRVLSLCQIEVEDQTFSASAPGNSDLSQLGVWGERAIFMLLSVILSSLLINCGFQGVQLGNVIHLDD